MKYTESKELCEYINRCRALDVDIVIENIVCRLEDDKLIAFDIIFDGLEEYIDKDIFGYKFPDYISILDLNSEVHTKLLEFLYLNHIIVLDLNMIEDINTKPYFNLSNYYDLFTLKIIYANNCKKIPNLLGMASGVKQLYVNSVSDVQVSNMYYPELELIEARGAKFVKYEGFKASSKLKKIYLDNCKMISSDAFTGCDSLEYVYAPNVQNMNSKFEGLKNLKEVDFSSLIRVGWGMFKDCDKLESVKLDECIDISMGGFINCDNLKELYLPKLKELNFNNFKKCYMLRKITIGKNTKLSADSRSISRSFVVKVIRE